MLHPECQLLNSSQQYYHSANLFSDCIYFWFIYWHSESQVIGQLVDNKLEILIKKTVKA